MYFTACILLVIIAYLLNRIRVQLNIAGVYGRIQLDLVIDREQTIRQVKEGYYSNKHIIVAYR